MGPVSPSVIELEASIPELMEKNRIPGLSIALIDGESLIWAEGFSYTDHTKRHRVTADTLFSLQSISKTYTATGFLIAASKGLVKLDDPLKKYYSEFRVNSRFGEGEADKITFRHLLSHRSGLTHEAPVGNNYSDRECTFEEHIESISETWLKFPVGERYSYSNLGMDLVGYALQRISEKPFTEYMREELFEPLVMTNSTYDQRYVRESLVFARGYRGDDEVPPDLIPMIPAGSLFSTAKDMAKFVSFHLSGGIVHGRRLIDKDLLWEMYRQQFQVKNQVCGYGLGVGQGWLFNTVFLDHSGGGYGYLTLQKWSPRYKIGAIVLTNQQYHSNVHVSIANEALGKMLKVKYGSVLEPRPLRFASRPVMGIETGKLRRLEGDYRVDSGLIRVRVKDGELYRTLPNGETGKLSPHSEIEFTNPIGEPYIFQLNERGEPKGILILEFSGPYYSSLENSTRDRPGPDRKEWRRYAGIYNLIDHRDILYVCTVVRNGYLHLIRSEGADEAKLREYKTNLFFTSDGEAVVFGEKGMTMGNIPLSKETDPYNRLLELTEREPSSPRLRGQSMLSLGGAYLALGEVDRALDTLVLNAKLHPQVIPRLLSLAEAYSIKLDKASIEKFLEKILEIDPKNEKALMMLKNLEKQAAHLP